MGSSVFLGCLEGWRGGRKVVKNYIVLDEIPEKGLEALFLRVRV